MRIEVTRTAAALPDDLNTYAEYRAFLRLAAIAASVQLVQITIKTQDEATVCLVFADLGPAGSVQSWARAAEPSRAIDVAVNRLEASIQHRLRGGLEPTPLEQPRV